VKLKDTIKVHIDSMMIHVRQSCGLRSAKTKQNVRLVPIADLNIVANQNKS